MGTVFQYDWEISLIVTLQKMIEQWPFLKGLFIFLTQFGEPVFTVLVVGFIYWGYKKEWGIYTILGCMTSQVFNNIIKNVFTRIRPYIADPRIDCLYPVEPKYYLFDPIKQGYSFPSGHTTSITGLLSSLYLYTKRKEVLCFFLLIPLVALSRISLGVHYPTDVIGGIVLGIVSIILVDRLYHRLSKKQFYLLAALLCFSGIFICDSEDYYAVIGIFLGFMAGDLFEEKHICFSNTKHVGKMLLRTLIGGLLFLGLSYLLKIPASLFEDGTKAALLYRTFRYGFSCFIIIGFYPYLFRYEIFR